MNLYTYQFTNFEFNNTQIVWLEMFKFGFTTIWFIVLAKVYGPLNEAAVPLRKAIPVKSGMTSVTAAKEGFPYPVGTPVPVSELSKELQKQKIKN